jgi:hypothetical protein
LTRKLLVSCAFFSCAVCVQRDMILTQAGERSQGAGLLMKHLSFVFAYPKDGVSERNFKTL